MSALAKTLHVLQVWDMMSITSYSLNQWGSIENHQSVKEQARQEEVQTGTKEPRQLHRDRELMKGKALKQIKNSRIQNSSQSVFSTVAEMLL